jgi:hypothetical protein
MTREKLYDFFVLDNRARRHSAMIDILFAGCATTVLILAGEISSDSEIAWSAGLLVTASFAFHLFRYSKGPRFQPTPQPKVPFLRGHWKLALATIAVASIVITDAWLNRIYSSFDSIHGIIPPATLPEGNGTLPNPSPQPAGRSNQLDFPSPPASVKPPNIQFPLDQQSTPITSLERFRDMDPQIFAVSLSDLQKVVMQSPSATVPDKPTISAIAAQLSRTPESSPQYWPTVLRFLQFASASNSPDVPPPGTRTNLQLSHVTRVVNGKVDYLSINANHCVARLEAVWITGRLENCRIIFTGEPVRMRNMQFVNCVFEFPDIDNPNPTIKGAAKELLASNLTRIPSL